MAEGTSTYNGLAPSLYGEWEQTQQTIGNDMVTLTGKSGMTGDFLVCQNSSGTEVVSISSAGAPTFAGNIVASSGLSVAKDATLTSGVSVGKNATFSSGASFAKVATFSSHPVVLGGSVALASDATSGSATNAGLTTNSVICLGGYASIGTARPWCFSSAGGFTLHLNASIGTAVTLTYVAFTTGA